MTLNRQKIKNALQDFGLSTNRVEELTNHLIGYDLEVTNKVRKKEAQKADFKDVKEVVTER